MTSSGRVSPDENPARLARQAAADFRGIEPDELPFDIGKYRVRPRIKHRIGRGHNHQNKQWDYQYPQLQRRTRDRYMDTANI